MFTFHKMTDLLFFYVHILVLGQVAQFFKVVSLILFELQDAYGSKK